MKKKNMNTYEEVGKKAGLVGNRLNEYIEYMKTRWSDTETDKVIFGYALEWAQRFMSGIEYQMSDSVGQRILENIWSKRNKKI